MAKVIAFGDSFTWGSDMKDTVRADLHGYDGKKTGIPYMDTYSRSTWQALLAKYYGLEYKCYAREGCSNDAIYRTFFEQCKDFKSDDVIVVNFTWRDRVDYFNEKTLEFETLRPTGTEDHRLFKTHYSDIHSWQSANLNSLMIINAIIDYLELNRFAYVATCIDEMIYNDDVHVLPVTEVLINNSRDKISWFDGKGLLQWSKDKNFPVSDWWHPLEEAHRAAFEYLIYKDEI